MKTTILIATLVTAALSANAFAADKTSTATHKKAVAAKPKVEHWKGTNISGGYVGNTGNTDSKNVNLGANIQYIENKWLYTGTSTYQFSTSRDSGTTANKLYALAKAAYSFTKSNFVYTSADYTDDRFDGYTYRTNINLGYGHNIPMPKDMTLSLLLGPGFRQSVLQSTGEHINDPTVQAIAIYNWNINPKTSLSEQLKTSAAKINTSSSSTTSIITSLTNSINLNLTYVFSYDSKPVSGKKATNSTTTLQFVYNF